MKIKHGWFWLVSFFILVQLSVSVALAQSVQLLGYKVTYDGRSYDSVGNTTTFSYTVRGINPAHALSHFVAGVPVCATKLMISSVSPSNDVVYHLDPSNPDPKTQVAGVKWDFGIGKTGKITYSMTFAGNLTTSTIQVAVKAGNSSAVGSLPGPCCNSNRPPVCDACGPYINLPCGSSNTTVRLNALDSFDEDGDTLSYQWSTNCPRASIDYPNLPTPLLSFDPSAQGGASVSCFVTLTLFDGVDHVQCHSAVGTRECRRDCKGKIDGNAVIDICGVCDGDGTSCLDCAGVPHGNANADVCGVCGGSGQSCAGCDGAPNSGKTYDVCGVCGGNGQSCAGCDGIPNSGKTYDACGVCGGSGAGCLGCDGVPNSGKNLDVCGVCGGNGQSCAGCDGVPNSGKSLDQCGVCGGDGRSCAGCDGVPNSQKIADACGICGGNGQSCAGCDGVPNSGKINDACGVCGGNGKSCGEGCKHKDACGVCNGDGTSCLGCDGTPNSGKIVDACGVCGGDGQSCLGCDGVPNSGMAYDACGECGGNGQSCAGCDGVTNSGKTVDICGVCGGNGTSCLGCDGVPNSGVAPDSCGVCGGTGGCLGCDGVPNSGMKLDSCGVCGGDNSCVDCKGLVNGGAEIDRCGICGGDGQSCLGCNSVNIFETQIALDGNSLQQRNIALHALRRLKDLIRNNRGQRRDLAKFVRASTRKAMNGYQSNWSLIYSLPQLQTACLNTTVCVSSDQSQAIETFNAQARELRQLSEEIIAKKIKIQAGRITRGDLSLLRHARRVEIRALNLSGTVPRSVSSCS